MATRQKHLHVSFWRPVWSWLPALTGWDWAADGGPLQTNLVRPQIPSVDLNNADSIVSFMGWSPNMVSSLQTILQRRLALGILREVSGQDAQSCSGNRNKSTSPSCSRRLTA
jgi:hypothetical protein